MIIIGKKALSFLLITVFLLGIFFASQNHIFAGENDHIMINEIQIGGAIANDEFIELYNPTDAEINLTGWDLKRKTQSGSESNILNNIEGTISAYGYFLIVPRPNCGESGADSCYKGGVGGDDEYTTNSFLAKDNTILLYNSGGNLVDKVGWGEAGDFEGEVINANQENNQSLERKTADSAIQDTDNNKNDFILQIKPNPQNSGSPKELPENPLPKNNPPVIKILLPENGSIYEEGETINFKAEISDLEDGTISNENIVWKEGDAELGKGNEIEVKNLTIGSHTITLEVQDSGGGKTIEEITVRIISAQNAENGGEESESGDEQNNSSQENGANSGQSGSFSAYSTAPIILPKIIITEFLPDPEDSDKDNEFIEIYNKGDVEVDLSRWGLEDKAGKTKKFAVPNGAKLKPKKYKIFYSDETGIVLNNSGDGIILKDDKDNVISETPICNTASEEQAYAMDENGKWVWTLRPTPGRKNVIKADSKSVSKSEEESKSVSENKGEKNTNDGSKKQEDSGRETEANKDVETDGSNEEQYNFSDGIIISEIYPNPKGKDNTNGSYEWIELYNNSDGDVNIKGWQIDDVLKKGSKPYVINEDKIIKAKSYEILDNAKTRLILNNSGDEINIIWTDGTIIDSVNYEKSNEGESYNLSNDESWFWSLKITPGKENEIENKILAAETKTGLQYALDTENLGGYSEGNDEEEDYSDDDDTDYIEANIKDLEHFTKYAKVKISGIISAPPGIFSDKSFYIYGSGIQIYSYQAQIPQLELGDYVEIIGRISEAGGEKRILLDRPEDMKVVYRLTEPKPKIISISSIGEEVEGWLVTIEGKVSEIFKDVFFVDDGSGKAKIYIKPQTGIKKPNIKIGDWIVVTGQVSQTSAGYRILPRFSRDIKISVAKETSTISENYLSTASVEKNGQGNKSSILYFVFIMMGFAILIDWGRMKIKRQGRDFLESR